jgi:hypothetical protein
MKLQKMQELHGWVGGRENENRVPCHATNCTTAKRVAAVDFGPSFFPTAQIILTFNWSK